MGPVINFETNVMQINVKLKKVNQSYTFQWRIRNVFLQKIQKDNGTSHTENLSTRLKMLG